MFYTVINGGDGLVSGTAKAAVSKALKHARSGHQVEIEEEKDGERVQSAAAMKMLEDALNPPSGKGSRIGNVPLHNALEKLSIYSHQLANFALRRALTEAEYNQISALLTEAESVLMD